ncbi:MAG: dephospho-CoA kinase [Acidimicrobiales bacterium]|jgi:dephospho-CoA kinase
MIEVGLTGGIGSGKSTVASGLVSHGAVLIDADLIVRQLQQPGESVFTAMVERFGRRIIGSDGQLDRAAVANIVFNDPDELTSLNEIVHPAVGAEMARRREKLKATDEIVIFDIPLLIDADGTRKSHYDHLKAIVVVDVPAETAVDRLVNFRGFDRVDAEARVAAQSSRDARLAHADFIVDNSGSVEALECQLTTCWTYLKSL